MHEGPIDLSFRPKSCIVPNACSVVTVDKVPAVALGPQRSLVRCRNPTHWKYTFQTGNSHLGRETEESKNTSFDIDVNSSIIQLKTGKISII